jgi:YidC/Oxa1 family membrane protein insertase
MGQQFYVIRNNPAPGTPAFAAKQERDEAKAARHGTVAPEAAADPDPGTTATQERPAQRQQPKRQSREQRKKQGKGKSGQQKPPPDDVPPTHEKQ